MFNKSNKKLEDRIDELEKKLFFLRREFMEYVDQLTAWLTDLDPNR